MPPPTTTPISLPQLPILTLRSGSFLDWKTLNAKRHLRLLARLELQHHQHRAPAVRAHLPHRATAATIRKSPKRGRDGESRRRTRGRRGSAVDEHPDRFRFPAPVAPWCRCSTSPLRSRSSSGCSGTTSPPREGRRCSPSRWSPSPSCCSRWTHCARRAVSVARRGLQLRHRRGLLRDLDHGVGLGLHGSRSFGVRCRGSATAVSGEKR